MHSQPWIGIVTSLAVAACGAARSQTRPDDMTAREHRDASSRHEREGLRAPYVRGSYFNRGLSSYGPHGSSWSNNWYPWSYSWNSGADHLEESDDHLAAAETLEKRYRDACALVSHDAESGSPLDRFAVAAEPLPSGVRVRATREAGPPDLMLAELRCHHAWLSIELRPGSENDVSSLAGVDYRVEAAQDEVIVTLTASDPATVAELQRRATLAVERASKEATP